MPRRKRGKWIAVGIAILGGLILAARTPYAGNSMNRAYFNESWQTSSNAFKTAATNWSIRPFDGYHLGLQYQIVWLDTRSSQIPDFVTSTCEVEVNVADRDEWQIKVVRDSCAAGSDAPHSITQVFALFRERATQPIGKAPLLGRDGCYLTDTGYLDLIDGRYDRELGYPYQIENVPQPWITGNCCSSIQMFPAASDQCKRVRVIVTELTPFD